MATHNLHESLHTLGRQLINVTRHAGHRVTTKYVVGFFGGDWLVFSRVLRSLSGINQKSNAFLAPDEAAAVLDLYMCMENEGRLRNHSGHLVAISALKQIAELANDAATKT